MLETPNGLADHVHMIVESYLVTAEYQPQTIMVDSIVGVSVNH